MTINYMVSDSPRLGGFNAVCFNEKKTLDFLLKK